MRTKALLLALMGILCGAPCLAQSGPPPLPQPMDLLDIWYFQDTNWFDAFGDPPLSYTNLALVPTWDGNGLQVDSSYPAWLSYPFESDGYPNLYLTNGTISCWVVPNWISSGLGGTGSGVWSRIIDVGAWTSNASYGWWSIFTDPTGDNIYFSAQTNNGMETNYLSAPIAWDGTTWHQIVLTYSASNTCLYLDGAFATNGPGISILPPPEVLSNGFFVLSDSTGIAGQFHGQADELWTYGNQETDTNEIASNYAHYNAIANPPPHLGSFGDSDPSGGTAGYTGGSPSGVYNPPYGSNDFWLQILPRGTNAYNTDTNSVTLILWGTIADIDYQIQMTTNIQTSNVVWTVVGDVLGSEVTNFTATTVSMLGLPTVYFRVLPATLDSDGDGLPDWWELKYSTSSFPLSPTNADTGNTGIPDGYKQDSAGDGYNNLQKYQMGVAPGTWVTPPTVTGFNVTLNSSDTSATLTWNPSPGPVIGYEILRADPIPYEGLGNFQIIATNSATSTSFTDSGSFTVGDVFNTYAPPGSQYQVDALYSGGGSAPVQSAALGSLADPCLAVNAKLIRGPTGRWLLAFSAIPLNVQSIQVSFPDWYFWYDSISDYDTPPGMSLYQTIAVSNLVNGCYTFPDNFITNFVGENEWLPYGGVTSAFYFAAQNYNFGEFAYEVFVQGADSSGTNFGPLVYAGVIAQDAPYVMDGRQALQESLSFLIQAAGETQPYLLPDETYQYQYFFSNTVGSNFIEHSFIHPGLCDKGYGYGPVPFVALDNVWPFTIDYLLAGWLYSSNAVPSFYWEPDYTTPSTVLATNGIYQSGPYWIAQDTGDLSDFGIATPDGGTNLSMASGVNNFFGLAQLPALCINSVGVNPADGLPNGPTETDELSPSDPVNFTDGPLGSIDSQFAAPVLSTVGYYFAPVNSPGMDVTNLNTPIQNYPLPLTPTFATTNETPLIIGVVGQPMLIGGWAKQSISNGASGKYAYLGQYFVTNAYKIDTNGAITTNATGLLSPYGEFLPTEPGPVALKTMPDLITGQQGTCTVQVVKLQLDVNHDGTMDTSWAGPDNTSSNAPFTFWVNDDCDYSSGPSDPGEDVNYPGHPDYALTNIPSERDLEDWARLWICGLPVLPTNCQVTLSWTNVQSGSPAINLVMPFETNGGTLYLTNNNIAGEQAEGTGVFAQSYKFARVTTNAPYTFTYTHITGNTTNCYLFEGAGIGSGELVMTIIQGTNVLATASAFMNLDEITNFIEYGLAENVSSTKPPSSLISQFNVLRTTQGMPNESKQMVVFVHGINNTPWAAENTTETIFKRLYWSGYRGRVAAFRWPCGYFPPESGINVFEFNESEFWAYKSATALRLYLNYLRNRPDLAGYNINILAHSQGSAVTGEALSLGATFDNCILTQGAVPAHCFYSNAPYLAVLTNAEAITPTPFAASVGGYDQCWTNISGNIINFFNTNDFALATGSYGLGTIQANWIHNQATQRPEAFAGGPSYIFYPSNQTTIAYLLIGYGSYTVTDWEESRAAVARSRTSAIGAQAPNAGQTNQGVINSSVDLIANFQFGITRPEHSGQFTRPIQAIWGYYDEVLTSYGIQPITR